MQDAVICFKGFTSTTLDRKAAITFACKDAQYNSSGSPPIVNMLIKINIASKKQHFKCGPMSAYPDEQEVLLQDGIEFTIQSIEDEVNFDHGKERWLKVVTMVKKVNKGK